MLLHELQNGMREAILYGPDFVDRDHFRGPDDRVDLGFLVHATTISHARLSTLEANFPRTREYLGHSAFNAISVAYIESDAVANLTLDTLGAGLSAWLDAIHQPSSVVLIAAFERAVVESCEAAEVPALELGELAGLSETDLLSVLVQNHPSVRLVEVDPVAADVLELGPIADGVVGRGAIVVTDPHRGAQYVALDESRHKMLSRSGSPAAVGDLLAFTADGDDCLGAFVDLLSNGALVRVEPNVGGVE